MKIVKDKKFLFETYLVNGHYNACPVCGLTGDNLVTNGASGRSGILVDGKVIVEEDKPGDLTGFGYTCINCHVSFVSKNMLSYNSSYFYPYAVPDPKFNENNKKRIKIIRKGFVQAMDGNELWVNTETDEMVKFRVNDHDTKWGLYCKSVKITIEEIDDQETNENI